MLSVIYIIFVGIQHRLKDVLKCTTCLGALHTASILFLFLQFLLHLVNKTLKHYIIYLDEH